MSKYTRQQLIDELFEGIDDPETELQNTLGVFDIQAKKNFTQDHYDQVAWCRIWISDQLAQGNEPIFNESMFQAWEAYSAAQNSIVEPDESSRENRTAEQILSEIETLDRLAYGTATETAKILARDGFSNVQQARKAYNLLYAQRLREYVESGELERQMYAMKEEQAESLMGKPLDLVEQAKALIASRTSRALPEGSSN